MTENDVLAALIAAWTVVAVTKAGLNFRTAKRRDEAKKAQATS
jgi:hypothetical protein